MTVPAVGVIGAGLAGSMVSMLLSKLGFDVHLFERRPHARLEEVGPREGSARESSVSSVFGGSTSALKRSINLALSERGMAALRELRLLEQVLAEAVPMSGRVIHSATGARQRQQYGRAGQCLYSVSRQGLNLLLLDELVARSSAGARGEGQVHTYFGYTLEAADKDGSCTFLSSAGERVQFQFALVIGADGAYSQVREQLLRQCRADFSRHYVPHGYKELSIPPATDNNGRPTYALPDPLGLHIWPRGEAMLIALPNADKSFTATLFAPQQSAPSAHSGPWSFERPDPRDGTAVQAQFAALFPDAAPLIPSLAAQYTENPVGALVTVRVRPWHCGRLLLLGDAAHAVVPFYGQGMNAAFEDALVLHDLLRDLLQAGAPLDSLDLPEAAATFSARRAPATDALADLCLEHYSDMAASTASPLYLLTRRAEALLHRALPTHFVPLYSLVTFSRTPYHEAVARSRRQDRLIGALLSVLGAAALAVTAQVVRTHYTRH